MMLFIISWCKPLEKDPSKKICTCTNWVKSFLPYAHPGKFMCVCYCSTWKCLILTVVSLENTKDCFVNQLFGCPKASFDLEWYAE